MRHRVGTAALLIVVLIVLYLVVRPGDTSLTQLRQQNAIRVG